MLITTSILYSDSISISISTEVQSYDLIRNIYGYPNPVRDIYRISFHSAGMDRVRTEIYSINGKLLESTTPFDITPGTNILEMDMGNYRSGIYIIRVFHENGSQKHLRVIKR